MRPGNLGTDMEAETETFAQACAPALLERIEQARAHVLGNRRSAVGLEVARQVTPHAGCA